MARQVTSNGVEIWESDRGYIESARYVDDDIWYHPGDPEFAALIARFNGQIYYGTAW